jgi:ribosome-associated toxin RatA of RatAB toxin-antitoxin module
MSLLAIRNTKLVYLKRNHAIDCFRILNRGVVTSRTHKERRLVRFSPEQLYQIVSHVESYHKFVPWCIGSNILRSTPTNLEAELVVGYGMFNEKYISDVELIRPSSVIAKSKQTNLLEYLTTKWSFSPCSSNPLHCWVTFEIDFKFKSALYNQVSDMFLQDVINSMVSAFEGRCRKEFCNVEKEKKRGTDTCN